MPNSKQIRLFWTKWIDRQYAKADPSHVKMRSELSAGEDTGTLDVPKAKVSQQERTNESFPRTNGSKRR